MAIDANGNVGGAAGALAALQALQLASQPSTSQAASSSGQTASGSSSAPATTLTQASFLTVNAFGQTGASQSTAHALANGASLTDAAAATAQSLSELLQHIEQTAKSATDPGLTSAGRTDLNRQLTSQISGFSVLLASAQSNGQNLLNGSLTANPTFAVPGGGAVSLQPQNLTLGGPLVSLTSSASVSTSSAAAETASLAGQSIVSVEAAIGKLFDQGDQLNGLTAQLWATQGGSGATAAADGADDGDSARLIALQIQQTLSAQPATTLSNPSSQAILSLFRG